jgi:hypothetical protein
MEEFRIDAALLKEMRETEQQAAKELGQWIEKAATTIRPEVEARANTLADAFTLEELEAVSARMLAVAGPEVRWTPSFGQNSGRP